MAIPAKVKDRFTSELKRMLPVIAAQKSRDVSEADTVTLVKDVQSYVFGYDKYAELTSEHAIRGTYCDLAVKLDEKLVQLIEVKSAGTALDDRHVKQAIDYAANQGVEWVVLTNATIWRIYQVMFAKPIDKRLLIEIDFTTLDLKKDAAIEQLYLLSKEGFVRGAHVHLRDRQDATSRYVVAALLTENESVLGAIRRELRRVVDVLVSDDDLLKVLKDEVIKRDTLEGPDAEAAARRVNRVEGRALRTSRSNDGSPTETDSAAAAAHAATDDTDKA